MKPFFVKRTNEDLDVNIWFAPRRKPVFQEMTAFFSKANRDLIRQSKGVKSLRLACEKHARQICREQGEKELAEAFDEVRFMKFEKIQSDRKQVKNLNQIDTTKWEVHITYRCPRCLAGASFGFRPEQLQKETLEIIEKRDD